MKQEECNNRHLKEILLDFVLGELTATDAQAVTKHLAECASCRDDRTFLDTLRTDLAYLKVYEAERHIEIEDLIDYSEARSKLSEEKILALRRHLLFCSDCEKELDSVMRLSLVPESEKSDEEPPVGVEAFSVRVRVTRALRNPIVGWAVAAGFAFFLILRSPTTPNRPGIDVITPQRIEQQMRSSSARPSVLRQSVDREVSVVFRLPANDLVRAKATLNDSRGKRLKHNDLGNALQGSFEGQISVDVHDLVDGEYVLILEARRTETGELVTEAYRFALQTKD